MQQYLNEHKKAGDKAKQQYDELNQKTVEKVKVYNPKLRCWIYERVETDPNAVKFERKTQQQRNVRPSETKRATPKKPRLVKTTPRKTVKKTKPKEGVYYNSGIKMSDKVVVIYNLFKEGKSPLEVAKQLKIDVKLVRENKKRIVKNFPDMVITADVRLPREKPKVKSTVLSKAQKEYVKYFEKGLTNVEISKIIGKVQSTVSYYFTVLVDKKGSKWGDSIKRKQQQRINENFARNYKR